MLVGPDERSTSVKPGASRGSRGLGPLFQLDDQAVFLAEPVRGQCQVGDAQALHGDDGDRGQHQPTLQGAASWAWPEHSGPHLLVQLDGAGQRIVCELASG
jgi:hypothetical protein